MSIFVDPNAFIDIELRYIEIKNSSEQVVGVKIIPEDAEPQENEKSISCKALGRDYDNMSHILEECTVINHITGNPMLRTKVLMPMIVEKFFVSWDQLDEKEMMIPINRQTINKMFYQLVKKMASKWLLKTSVG